MDTKKLIEDTRLLGDGGVMSTPQRGVRGRFQGGRDLRGEGQKEGSVRGVS